MVVCDTLCFHSTLCCGDNAFFYDNFQNLFQTADIGLLLANIVPEVCLFIILHRESAQLAQENIKSEILIQMQVFN